MPVAELFQEAITLQQSGRLREAAQRYQSVLQQQPDHFGALQLLGMLHVQMGQPDSAARLLAKAVEYNPAAADVRNNYGMVLHSLGRYDEALAQYDKAIAANPRHAVAFNNLGNTFASLHRPDEAIERYRQALIIEPRYAEALNNLGIVLQAVGRVEEAIARFEAALAVRPDFAGVQLNLATVLIALGRNTEAVAAFSKAIVTQPGNPMAHFGLGNALRAVDRPEEAIAHYRRACVLQPKLAATHASLGVALQEVGRIDEARTCFDKAIEIEPNRPSHYLKLTINATLAPGDPRIVAMEALADHPDSLPKDEQVALYFALGKALADIGSHERSFTYLLTGNALHRQHLHYQEAQTIGRLRRIREVFTPALMRRRQGAGDPTRRPIFIVGMPRSGSTLVEQILASHPSVFAAGEMPAFRDALAALPDPTKYPENIHTLPDVGLRQFAADYLAKIEAIAASRRMSRKRITDKLPTNFRYMGLIHLAMPNARIIHTYRDPIDTCLSCFSTFFAGVPFAYDLAELGRYYRAYEQLMAHWRGLLPQGAVLDVRYEDLVSDLAAQTRRIVEYCELEWDDACLTFHQSTRPVRTSSVVQVRRPIYQSSVGRWRPAAEVLRPLLNGLEGVSRTLTELSHIQQ
jgi:tetratricopeptide (TPR) repeat protein